MKTFNIKNQNLCTVTVGLKWFEKHASLYACYVRVKWTKINPSARFGVFLAQTYPLHLRKGF